MPNPRRHILVAPDAFKESMTSAQAAHAIARGLRLAGRKWDPPPRIVERPLSDGGAGFVEALCAGAEHRAIPVRVAGPLDEPIDASFALLDRPQGPVAVMQMSAAAGLALVPHHQRDPEKTTTFGVGEMIGAALDAGAREILIGVGNSATCDGGAGLLAALGARFLDESGQLIPRPTGADLARIASIDAAPLRARLAGAPIVVACDVNNPLCGEQGSARVFGPQKGAKPAQIDRLDAGMRNLAARSRDAGATFDPDTPGAGAAGGVAFGLAALAGAALRPGAEIVLDALGFDDLLRGAGLLITGEGRLDATSFSGKAAFAAARRAQRAGVRAVAMVGSVGPGWERALTRAGGPFEEVRVITPEGLPLESALRDAPRLLQDEAARMLAVRGMLRRPEEY